jgi:hypothetical protein
MVVLSTGTTGNQISNTCTFLSKGPRLKSCPKKLFTKANHFHQSNVHNCCFCIITPSHSVHKSSSYSNNILQGTTESNTGNIADNAYMEIGAVENGLKQLVIKRRVVNQKRLKFDFGELPQCVPVRELDDVDLQCIW